MGKTRTSKMHHTMRLRDGATVARYAIKTSAHWAAHPFVASINQNDSLKRWRSAGRCIYGGGIEMCADFAVMSGERGKCAKEWEKVELLADVLCASDPVKVYGPNVYINR